MTTKRRFWGAVAVGGSALLIAGVFLLPRGTRADRLPAWLIEGARLKLALRTDSSAGSYYERTARGPLSLAAVVSELHAAWPKETCAVVHDAALEIASDLLHHGDVEAGEIANGAFRPLPIPPWAAREKVRSELSAAHDFFQDPDRFVFRRK